MIHFTLYTLEGVSYDDDAYEVTIPTQDGIIGVLSDHMPLVSVAGSGTVLVRRSASQRDDQREEYKISGGAIMVEHNQLRILVDEADRAIDSNDLEVQKAYDRASRLREDAKEQISLQHAQTMVDRQGVRLHVSNIKRRHHDKQL